MGPPLPICAIQVVSYLGYLGPLPPKACNPPCSQKAKADIRALSKGFVFDPVRKLSHRARIRDGKHGAVYVLIETVRP
jgi:hypothetical protein